MNTEGDTNVLIDVLADNPKFIESSIAALRRCQQEGQVQPKHWGMLFVRRLDTRRALALQLTTNGEITLSRAANVAGMSIWEMDDAVSLAGIRSPISARDGVAEVRRIVATSNEIRREATQIVMKWRETRAIIHWMRSSAYTPSRKVVHSAVPTAPHVAIGPGRCDHDCAAGYPINSDAQGGLFHILSAR